MFEKLLKSKTFQLFWEYFMLWATGGVVYYCVELLWRGYSHPSMYVLGGVCFIALGLINQFYFTWNMKIWYQMLVGAILITILEFIVGCIVNIWLGWDVWDYSNMPLNICGQVCLGYTVLWYFLSAVGIFLDDSIRWTIFGEEIPHYYIK